ncbi:hypothetical protein QA447_31225 [Pseudomonas sp. abacavir_1]|nr:hypothetical protein [Pseudomonas aeruginosa]
MKIIGRVEIEAITDVKCDVCSCSTRLDTSGFQFASIQAHWGFGTKHDGERYELHLCEDCFFGMIAYLKQERRIQNLFDENDQTATDDLGLVTRDDFWGDSKIDR